MKNGIQKLVSAVLLCAIGGVTPASADGDAEFVAAYEKAKPTPGGITPGTAKEYARCWMVWSRMGQLAIDTDDGLEEIHKDWSVKSADSLFQHWWKKAETAYAARYDDQAGQRLMDEAQKQNDYFYDKTKIMETMEWAGACYVPAEDRLAFDEPRPLVAYLEGARAPQTPSVEFPKDMLANIVDGTIAVNKKKKFKKLQKVLVPHFAVSFGIEDSATARSNSRNTYGAGASAAASAELRGLSDSLLQKITDAALEDFKRQMASNGYEAIVGPQAQQMLLNSQKMRYSKVFDGPVKDMSVYHFAFNGNFKDVTYAPTGMKLINPMWEASMATKKLDFPSLNVQYSVHFAWFDGKSSYDRRAFSGNEAMAASMGTNLNVQVIYSSGIEILGDTANNPKVSVDGTFFSKSAFTDNVEVKDSGGGSRKRRKLVVTANQDAYYRESIKTISRANTGLISQMASLKQ